MSALLDSLVQAFEDLPADRVEAAGLGESRRAALRQALVHGLPTPRSEGWKYTALRALGARGFALDGGAASVEATRLAGVPGPRLVFVNGRFEASLSLAPERAGLQVRALSSGSAGAGANEFAPPARPLPEQVFASLNDALALEGAVVDVEPGVDAGVLHLVFVSAPAAGDLAMHLRHRIRLGRGARLQLVEHHLADAPHRHLANHLMQVQLADGARLAHARLQDEHEAASVVARTDATLGEAAEYRRVDLELGAALSRHEVAIRLAGRGARCEAGGVLLADGRRHLDTRLVGAAWPPIARAWPCSAPSPSCPAPMEATRAFPARTCCSRKARKWTRNRCWRSTPTK